MPPKRPSHREKEDRAGALAEQERQAKLAARRERDAATRAAEKEHAAKTYREGKASREELARLRGTKGPDTKHGDPADAKAKALEAALLAPGPMIPAVGPGAFASSSDEAEIAKLSDEIKQTDLAAAAFGPNAPESAERKEYRRRLAVQLEKQLEKKRNLHSVATISLSSLPTTSRDFRHFAALRHAAVAKEVAKARASDSWVVAPDYSGREMTGHALGFVPVRHVRTQWDPVGAPAWALRDF